MDKDPKTKDVKTNLNAKINVTPGTTSRQIQGLTANEMKVQIDMEIQTQAPSDAQNPGQPSGPVSGTISTNIDSWVAPSVPGYEEVAGFYHRMAKEINWVPPSSIHVDPRVSQSMDELQKNQSAFKGLPLLQYLSMTMVGQQGAAANTTDATNANADGSSSSSRSDTPTSASDAMVKGLGGLFSKKKKKDDAEAQQNSQNPPPPSTPGSLMEMTDDYRGDVVLRRGVGCEPVRNSDGLHARTTKSRSSFEAEQAVGLTSRGAAPAVRGNSPLCVAAACCSPRFHQQPTNFVLHLD
jgi:hypothetical protein